MLSFRPQFVLAATVFAALCLGGARANAGYVSVAMLANDAGGICSFPFLGEFEGSGSRADPQVTSGRRREVDDSDDPLAPVFLLQHLLNNVCNYGLDNGCGTTSGPSSGNGPSAPLAGDLQRPSVPPLVLISLLPPQTGDAHPFSIGSFLFRPPRAA